MTEKPTTTEKDKNPKTPDEEGAEPDEETGSGEESKPNAFLSPEGLIMMSIAGFLDIFGLIGFIPGVGTLLSYIPDILGIITIGSWTLFRSQTIKATPRAAETLKKGAELAKKSKAGKKVAQITKRAGEMAKKAKWLKKLKWVRILAPVGELVPIVGIAPLWIIAVYFELKN